jgi:hypothetical protein
MIRTNGSLYFKHPIALSIINILTKRSSNGKKVAVIVGLDARNKGPSPLVGENNISPKYISGIINLYMYILKKIVSSI